MSRPRLVVLTASMAALAVGCAHCDICDDFPAPCTGPNCGYPYQATFPIDGGMPVEPIVEGPVGIAPGTIIQGGGNASSPPGAPSIEPPAPARPNGSGSGSGSGGPSSNGSDSRSDGANSGSDPLDIAPPPAPADSPFGSPFPRN